MFCANCGAQVPDGTKFCPSCGKPCSTGEKVKQAAEDVFNKSEQELGNAFEDVSRISKEEREVHLHHIPAAD